MMSHTTVSVLSWNVLADAYVRPDWFPLTSGELLLPGARTNAVLAMIGRLDADVVALQEADTALASALRAALPDFDVRWCPKARNRPDGCITAARRNLPITDESRLIYQDGEKISGHVAHVLDISVGERTLTVANTHLRFAPNDTPEDEHLGLRQVRQLTSWVAGKPHVVLAMDSNDETGGPVRRELAEARFTETQGSEPTSIVDGTRMCQLDLIAVRGLHGGPVHTGLVAQAPMPSTACPSDHLPIVTALHG